ncbi:hypothetical protein BH18ACT9_BH18ACT9_07250 [soil metagenome]
MEDPSHLPALRSLTNRVAGDSNVLGLVLTGSWARDLATANSDVDVYVIVQDRQGWTTTRSREIDLPVLTLEDLRAVPEDPTEWWDRYSFVDSRVVLDRTNGLIEGLIDRWASLDAAEVDRCLTTYLDGYVNFVYRSLKSERDARPLEQRLDAVESISWLLWVVFALFGRVRPYNKYLQHELAVRPLADAGWTDLDLIGHLKLVMDSGDAVAQSDISRLVESSARRLGHGTTLDAWGDEQRLLRGV